MLMQTPYFGNKKLSQVLPERGDFARNMPCALDDATDAWGTEIECEEIRNANCATLKSHRFRSTSVPRIQGKAGELRRKWLHLEL